MIGLVRNEWKKVFLPVLLTTVLLAIAMSVLSCTIYGICNLLAYGWPYRGIPIQHWINNRFFQVPALCGFDEVP